MSCCSTQKANHCSCGSSMNPEFWSTKKKLKMLEHKLECLDDQKKDIQETIDELKKDK